MDLQEFCAALRSATLTIDPNAVPDAGYLSNKEAGFGVMIAGRVFLVKVTTGFVSDPTEVQG